MNKIKCPICGTEMDDVTLTDCPYCDWEYDGVEGDFDENEVYGGPNYISVAEAKRLVSEGKDIWGEPLPKRK